METRQLDVDGDDVLFALKYSGQAMAVRPNGKSDAGTPILTAALRREGRTIWSGQIRANVMFGPIEHQFSDDELRQLYRAARGLLGKRGTGAC